MKNDFVMPILVLSLICLAISGALALTNSITAPVIEDAAAQREEAARYEIIPEADGFELITAEGLPATVSEVFRATNGTGYVFIISASGYGGEMKIICGIGPDGKLIRSKALEQAETKGLGSKITEESFSGQFEGKDDQLDGIVAITGATLSSSAYTGAIHDAFEALRILVTDGLTTSNNNKLILSVSY